MKEETLKIIKEEYGSKKNKKEEANNINKRIKELEKMDIINEYLSLLEKKREADFALNF